MSGSDPISAMIDLNRRYLDLYIPGTFWIDRLDVLVEIVPDEEANTGIAIATARLDDEVRGNFHTQIPVKFKRFGYIYGVHWGHMVDPRTPNWGSISITPGKLRATGGIGHS